MVPLAALKPLGMGRVCLLASGETAAALRSLFKASHLDQLVRVFGELPDALQYLSGNKTG